MPEDELTHTGQDPQPASEPPEAAVQPTATQRSPEDLERRERWIRIVGGLVVIVLVGLFASYGYTVASARLGAARKVDRAAVLISSVDQTVIDVDETVRAKVTPEVGARAAALKSEVDEARGTLDEAVALLDDAYADLNDEDREHSGVLRDAAVARSEMLKEARSVLEATSRGAEALEPARAGWALILSGEKRADDAVTNYNKLTREGVQASSKLNAQAREDFSTAKEQFELAKEALPALDTALYVAYIDGKLRLLGISEQSDKAWLASDPRRANKLAAEYNAEEKKVIELAKKLPDTPETLVAKAYEDAASASVRRYFAARDRATVADEALREY